MPLEFRRKPRRWPTVLFYVTVATLLVWSFVTLVLKESR
jgi:hypothetical protein